MAGYVPDRQVGGPDLPDPDNPPADPTTLLRAWLPEDDEPERPLMTLGTVDSLGWPDARTVLLSSVDGDGLHFHTDAGSRKVAQLSGNPRAVATLVWPQLLRQLVVQGPVLRDPDAHAADAYTKRPRYLQLLAWLNTTDYARRSLADRTGRWATFVEEHPEGTLIAPQAWVGFVLRPTRVTFWQGRADRASIRIEYRLGPGGAWASERLPG